MAISKKIIWKLFLTTALVTGSSSFLRAVEPVAPSTANGPAKSSGEYFGVTTEQAVANLEVIAPSTDEKFDINPELSRGPAASVYPKVAPAVVVVQTPQGHGTGFIIDKSGWIVTNHHVISGAKVDVKSGCLYANIHLGKLEDGLMTVDPQLYTAIVFNSDPAKDLAILKMLQLPIDRELSVVELAMERLNPGEDCVAIGHPSRGTLWTVRSGEVAGVAEWPKGSADVLASTLALAGTDQEQAKKQLAAAAQRKVILSTCGINPGDSGGPLLNTAGQLVGVTFGIPKGGVGEGISLDKFSYHVHLDELQAFLAKRPASPRLYVPPFFPAAQLSLTIDFDNDGTTDRWQFVNRKETDKPDAPAEYTLLGFLVDVDQDSPQDIADQLKKDPNQRDLFDFEFAIRFGGVVHTFYDTDNDGKVDLILTDINKDDISDLSISLTNGDWKKIDLQNQQVIDPSLFKDAALRDALMARVIHPKPDPNASKESTPAPPVAPPVSAPPAAAPN